MSRLPVFMTAAVAALLALPASAVPVVFVTSLSGAAEAPPNASPGTGDAIVTFDLDAHTMRVEITFSGLTAGNTAAHIHCCTAVAGAGTAGVATTTPTFTGFPTGATSGDYDHVFDMTLASSYRAAFLGGFGGSTAAAEAALFNGVRDGKAYVNIHTSTFPGGEIRGFLQVPEPASYALALVALAGLAGASRRGSSAKGR